MAARRGPTVRAPRGFEPAKGFPDPSAPAPLPQAVAGGITHMPHSNGTVCGRRETRASAYTTEEPTCPKCKAYFVAVQATAKRNKSALDAPPAPTA